MRRTKIHYRDITDPVLKRRVLFRAYNENPGKSKREVIYRLVHGIYNPVIDSDTGDLVGIRDSECLSGVFGISK